MRRFMRIRIRAVKNLQIALFARVYRVDLEEAAERNFRDFNTFFTRALKRDARPIGDGVVSPADGIISQAGDIYKDRLIQAKGLDFATGELLGDKKLGEEFNDGSFATIYLSPRDYHRVHIPLAGRLREMTFIPGRLFSVNPKTTTALPRLFVLNERLVTIFETDRGLMAVVFVGAIFVGSIQTVWRGEVFEKRMRRWTYGDATAFNRGDEIGRFNMGSTVIVLFQKDRVTWSEATAPGAIVAMGQTIGA